MRTLLRTRLDGNLVRSALALGVASAVVGLSFGAIGVSSGLPAWAPILMSLIVFAGGSQFLAVGMLAAGNPIAAVLGGLLVNARHLPFGLAVGAVVGDKLPARLLGSHILLDENTAFVLTQEQPMTCAPALRDSASLRSSRSADKRRQAYWLVGGVLFVMWNLGSLAGVLLGGAVGDPSAFGLDAAFPAGMLALILPSFKDKATRTAALLGAAIAVLATPLLPPGLPVLLSLLAVLVVAAK